MGSEAPFLRVQTSAELFHCTPREQIIKQPSLFNIVIGHARGAKVPKYCEGAQILFSYKGLIIEGSSKWPTVRLKSVISLWQAKFYSVFPAPVDRPVLIRGRVLARRRNGGHGVARPAAVSEGGDRT